MSKYSSFKNYLENKYYNEMYNAIKIYMLNHKNLLGTYSRIVIDTSYIDLDDIHVMGVSFHKKDGDLLRFCASVQADVILRGIGKRDYEADEQQLWFSVCFSGRLHNGLNRVTITKVDLYSKDKFNSEDSLSRFFVPYLYAKDLDKEAEKFLKKYYGKALKSPMPIKIDELLQNMGLEMHYAPLQDNIFGMTYFSEADVEVCDFFKKNIETRHIEAGTILINPKVFFMRNVGSKNNTIVHECVHWDRHRDFFELQKLLSYDVSHISCEVVEEYSTKTKDIDKALKWMEWQANALTPHILMPAETTKQKFQELLSDLRKVYPNRRNAIIVEFAVASLADFFDVSVTSAKIRLTELGFDFVQGTNVFVDGRSYPPYSFREDTLSKDQTFVIDAKSAIIESNVNPKLIGLVQSGALIYANAMFCCNDDKYVTRNNNGTPILTDYALEHVDECCVVFDRKTRISEKYDDSYYRRCFLCRDIDSGSVVEATYNPDYKNNQDVSKRAEEIQKTKAILEETLKVQKETAGMEFHELLAYHIKRRGLTEEELAFRSGLSSRMVGEYHRKSYNIQLPTVLALCIGLNLKPEYCYSLIERAGYQFKNTNEHMVYKYLINNHTDENLESWNRILAEFDISQRLPNNRA